MSNSGRYQHYKGGFYEVVGLALHSETKEEMIVYKALEASQIVPAGTLWVRPKKMFEESVLIDGKKVPRFKRVSEEKI